MSRLSDAVVIDSDDLFNAIEGDSKEAVFEYRFNMPFTVDKAHKPEHDEGDTVVYGPVYVGDEKMLDRHRELVDAEAIMKSWDTYSKNPVILYNHRKDYGVIGLMESVEMGMFTAEDGTEMEAVFGRAVIDSGEIDITRKINKGMLRAFSIGFMAKAAVKEGTGDEAYIRFTNIEWIETSVVDIPASPNALFNVSKSLVSYGDEIIAEQPRADSISEMSEKLDLLITHLSTPIGDNTLKDHVPEVIAMTEANLTDATEEEVVVEEALIELSEPTETVLLKTEEVLEEEEEVLEEEVLEEEVLEEAEEAVEEEVLEEEVLEEEVLEEEVLVEEVAEATEEESLGDELVELSMDEDTPTLAILSEVVLALSQVEESVKSMHTFFAEVESLKAALAEKESIIASMTEQTKAAEAEAAIEAEVSRRLAEKMAEANLAPTAASPKSLSTSSKTLKVKTGTTKHDPTPEVSNGMAHLGSWLENRLGAKRTGYMDE
jgi:phage head maturation protease|tara:strand:+ start:258 stop:1724 length:1467 start_codon:yes stop_codon:yes gene_type:complete